MHKLRRPSALEGDEIAQRLRSAYGCATARDALVEAIQRALRHHEPRFATIIQRCDVERELTSNVAGELHFSPRTFFRYRSAAIEAVGVEIARVLHGTGYSRDPLHSEASHAYAIGRYLLQRLDPTDDRIAITWLERAVTLAPRMVDGWTTLATANVNLALAFASQSNRALTQARAYIDRALELAPRSPRAQAVNARVTLWETCDLKRARDLAYVALDGNDRMAHAHCTLGWADIIEGNFDGAERSFERAATDEPGALQFLAAELTVPFFRGDYDSAAERARELLEIEPDCEFVLGYLTEALNMTGRYAETVVVAAPLAGHADLKSVKTAYARALAILGDRDGALAVRQRLNGPGVMVAAIDLALGETSRALDELERALADDDGRLLTTVVHDPAFEQVRDEPRFARIIRTYRNEARA